ncbi:hypothetical protein [Demequina silvatica]|uniref:hypothetical protein n=1 Tax=Demequina silvatica TaxID=1638988 RepID=UPI0007860B69|nr:hypothetical protein [Demequina silvatica]
MTRQNTVTVRWGWMLVALGIAALGAVVFGFASVQSCASGGSCSGGSVVDVVQTAVIAIATLGGVAWAVRRGIRPARTRSQGQA